VDADGRGEVEQKAGSLAQAWPGWDGPQPRGHGPDLECFSVCAFYIRPGSGTVRARIADATVGGPPEAQLLLVTDQVRPGPEELRRDRGKARAIDGGKEGGPEADPALGAVAGSGADDHSETCEDPHRFAGGPSRSRDPEVTEDLSVGASGVERRPGLDGGTEHDKGLASEPGAANPDRDGVARESEMLMERRSRAGPWSACLEFGGDPAPHWVRACGPSPPPRYLLPNSRRGVVNRLGRCYVLGRTQLVSRWIRETGSQDGEGVMPLAVRFWFVRGRYRRRRDRASRSANPAESADLRTQVGGFCRFSFKYAKL
jgi:hypothetical protein